ncbi:MAG TPA: hypothetical protein VH302_15420 [Bryobacteraceae bacterium]|jgi:hypothetical protein|nr:hypothetical protein [Bryobacteraceae bacterium]
MTRRHLLFFALLACAAVATAQEKGPKPPQKDLPYLLEANRLIPTDAQPATRSTAKDDVTITVAGVTSKVRTPLPEPIFLFSSGQIDPQQFELIRFQVSDGGRHWKKGQPIQQGDEPDEPLRLTLSPKGEKLYRIEASPMLAAGEYAIIARGQNTAFCFTVF